MHVDQITEMAAVMRKAIDIDEKHGCKEQERIIQLEVSMKSKQHWHNNDFSFPPPPPHIKYLRDDYHTSKNSGYSPRYGETVAYFESWGSRLLLPHMFTQALICIPDL